jgi:hypothetical protein
MIPGGAQVSRFQRVTKFAKLTTLLSGALTILSAMIVAGLELTSWVRTGVWDAYRLSWAMRLLKGDRSAIYVTASSNTGTALTTKQAAVEWLLAIPVTVPLLGVAALHLAFYWYLSVPEEEPSVRVLRRDQ